MITLLAVLTFTAAEPLRLRGLVATSGANVEAVLDSDDTKGWQPPGRAIREGITFSFESPTKISKISITPCKGSEAGTILLYCDGAYRYTKGSPVKEVNCGDWDVKTVFLQITSNDFCVAEVRFYQGETALAVAPPRSVAATMEASSTLAPAEAFHPTFLVDGRLDFGWAEGGSGSGETESVTFGFAAEQTVTAIEIWNGYQRSADHFAKNARAKSITLSTEGGSQVLALADKDGAQKLMLAVPLNGKVFKLTVDAVYPGKKYKDLVISELRFFDATGPFVPSSTYREDKQKQFLATHKQSAAAAVIDAPLVTMCSQSIGTLKLRSNASFIADFEETEDVDASVSRTKKRVIEGAWVPSAGARADAASLVFDLYAKQYMSRATMRQYGKSSTKETVGIIGGKHTLYDFAKMSDAAYAALVETWKKQGSESFVACTTKRTRADFAKEKIVFIGGPVFNDFFSVR